MKRVVVLCLGLLALAVPAQAKSVASSGAVVVRGAGSEKFTLELPQNAACPGDSAHQDYRVQSFLVPVSADPGSLYYKSQNPDTPNGWPLYVDATTSPYLHEQTANAQNETGPGEIIAPPEMSLRFFEPQYLPAGRYHMGVACSLLGQTEKYWSTEIVVAKDLSWKLANASESRSGSSDSEAGVVVGAVVAVVVAGLVGRFVIRRRTA